MGKEGGVVGFGVSGVGFGLRVWGVLGRGV